jgi:hypothetical protein
MKDGFGRELVDDIEFAEMHGTPLVSTGHLWFGRLLQFASSTQTSTLTQLKRGASDVLMEVPQEVKDAWPGIFESLCTCAHFTISHVGLDKRCTRCKTCNGFTPTAVSA